MPARSLIPPGDNDTEWNQRYEQRRDRFPPSQRCDHWRDGNRCRRFAVRAGRFCPMHQRGRRYFVNRKKEAEQMRTAREITEEARELARVVHRDLRVAAPDAVRVLVELALNEELSPAVRLKAASELLRHSGMSLEKVGDVNLTVNLSDPDASDIIRARLDRLAATSPVIAGELDHSP